MSYIGSQQRRSGQKWNQWSDQSVFQAALEAKKYVVKEEVEVMAFGADSVVWEGLCFLVDEAFSHY